MDFVLWGFSLRLHGCSRETVARYQFKIRTAKLLLLVFEVMSHNYL